MPDPALYLSPREVAPRPAAFPPFVGRFGKAEIEYAIAAVVWACTLRNEWGPGAGDRRRLPRLR